VPKPAVSSTAEEEAVVEFFDWITGPEPQAQWHKRTGYFPINKESRTVLEDEGFFEENPAWTAGFDSLEESETSAHTRLSIVPQAPDIKDLRANTWTEMRQGGEPDAVLDEYKTQIDSVLREN
jgi:sn-glycerol 3-phosphate transport system substrate-binding protein